MPRKNNHNKRITIVCHYYPPHQGGIEYVAQSQARQLTKLGYSVTVITSKIGRAEPTNLDNRIKVIRVRVFNLGEKFGVPYPIFSPRLLSVLDREIKQTDIVHVHDSLYMSTFFGALFAKLYKKPLVLTQHVATVTHPKKIVGYLQNLLYATSGRWVLKSSQKILTLNDRVDKFLVDRSVDKIKIVPIINGVDTQLFNPPTSAEKRRLRSMYGFGSKKVVLFVGRFVPKKGYLKLLKSVSPDYDLVFAGSNTSDPIFNSPGLKLAGILTQPQLADLYKAADIFVLPSSDEGFPLTIQEAMASGLPVVTSDDDGYKRYHLDKTLFKLIKPTVKQISLTLKSLTKDQVSLKKMSNYSRQYALKHFALSKVSAQLDEIYNSLIEPDYSPESKTIVTTSWDDGHILDIKLANLLKKYNIAGTFYIAPKNQEIRSTKRLKDEQVVSLSRHFEIGAHTLTHPQLPKISKRQAAAEITQSKSYLEKLIGKSVTSFCYPRGQYNQDHVRMVNRAGYQYARTVRRHVFQRDKSVFETSTTIHAYSHWLDIYKIARFANFNPKKFISYLKWDKLAIAMFDRVQRTGGVYHLWGHSWEIDQNHDWAKLETVLKYIANKPAVTYTTNGQSWKQMPLNALVAAPYFPPHIGGQENYAYHLAQLIQADPRWNVVVATSGNRGLFTQKNNSNGLTIYHLPYWFKVSNTPINPLWPFMLQRVIKSEKIDIINSHAPVPYLADMVRLAHHKVPIVLTYHMVSMKKGRSIADAAINVYEDLILPSTLKKSQAMISASDTVKQYLKSRYKQLSTTIEPGVDSSLFSPANLNIKDRLLFVADLNKSSKHKGLDILLLAMTDVTKHNPKAELIVVGGGSNLSYFQKKVDQLRLTKSVHFLGALQGEALVKAYQQASVFILPSLNDNIPLSILEAMSCGLPVISTAVGNIPHMVSNQKDGYIVAPGDSDNLARKIINLLDNPSKIKSMGQAARTKVVSSYDWQKQSRTTSRLYIKILGQLSKVL